MKPRRVESLIALCHLSKALPHVIHPFRWSLLYGLLQQPPCLIQPSYLRGVLAEEVAAELIVMAVWRKQATQKAQEHVKVTQWVVKGSHQRTLDQACDGLGLFFGCKDLGHMQDPRVQDVLLLCAKHCEDIQSSHELLQEGR